jgi:hypothetical protein
MFKWIEERRAVRREAEELVTAHGVRAPEEARRVAIAALERCGEDDRLWRIVAQVDRITGHQPRENGAGFVWT